LAHGPVHATLRGGEGRPLTLWFDRAEQLGLDGSTVQLGWTDAQRAGLLWSTWPSWERLGAAWSAQVEERLASGGDLGRQLTRPDLVGLGVEGIADEVRQLVQTAAGDTGTLAVARPASETLSSG